ncbi:hypothetical protein AXG93_3911s1720 [Marchantia polymorpha subsp. ruderalis]|uniref:Uncharacterized protein n=1 Tax=Marchantia polymorpha subsp. ruderalis TaxID=1480154 RepID=A0A176W375_MARPO|nr:hypothetical protein AXG93_3911s1720 [Marchantia polymorpha subsp. ruderalis]
MVIPISMSGSQILPKNVLSKVVPVIKENIYLDIDTEDDEGRDRLSIECMKTLNEALYLYHKRKGCRPPGENKLMDDTKRSGLEKSAAERISDGKAVDALIMGRHKQAFKGSQLIDPDDESQAVDD